MSEYTEKDLIEIVKQMEKTYGEPVYLQICSLNGPKETYGSFGQRKITVKEKAGWKKNILECHEITEEEYKGKKDNTSFKKLNIINRIDFWEENKNDYLGERNFKDISKLSEMLEKETPGIILAPNVLYPREIVFDTGTTNPSGIVLAEIKYSFLDVYKL